jgi:transposase
MSVIEAPTQVTPRCAGRPPVAGVVTVGVDTHQLTHHAAVIDPESKVVGDREFPATAAGYRQLADWMAEFGLIATVGVESPGSYGAGLTRHLLAAGIEVVEVNRPEKTTRVTQGKSDPIDAISAARQAQAGTATGNRRSPPGSSRRSGRSRSPATVRSRTAPAPTPSCATWPPPPPLTSTTS